MVPACNYQIRKICPKDAKTNPEEEHIFDVEMHWNFSYVCVRLCSIEDKKSGFENACNWIVRDILHMLTTTDTVHGEDQYKEKLSVEPGHEQLEDTQISI